MCFGMKIGDNGNCSTCREPHFNCTYYVFGARDVVFEIGVEYITTEHVNHEDWKTVMAHPDRYPIIPTGERVKFLGRFINLYGEFARVEYNNKTYDVNHNKLTYL